MSPTEIVRMEKVGKAFGSFQVLADVDLVMQESDRVVIVGPSGSGKSTLIRCINGLETHDTGRIVVAGVTLSEEGVDIEAVRRQVGMVFQQFNLFPHLTILENCALAPIWVRKMPRPEAEALARRYLDRVHIADQADKFPAQLSGGQQQRVAIARALAMEPKVILFDEPTSALDPALTKEVLDVMLELTGTGMTMLVVTHEMAFARRFAHRIVYIEAGRILEETPTEEFFTAPRTAQARAFLGLAGG